MGLKSSRAEGAPAEARGLRPSEFLGYQPTVAQIRARSDLWSMWRDDPLFDPTKMSFEEVAAHVDAPSLKRWWADPHFRQWFLKRDGWKADAEFAFQLAISRITERLVAGTMSDKDLVSTTKLLLGATERDGETSAPTLTLEEAQRLFEQTARQQGWLPPASKEGK